MAFRPAERSHSAHSGSPEGAPPAQPTHHPYSQIKNLLQITLKEVAFRTNQTQIGVVQW